MKALYEIYLKRGRLQFIAVEGVRSTLQASQVKHNLERNNPDIEMIDLISISEIPVYTLAEVDEKNLIREWL